MTCRFVVFFHSCFSFSLPGAFPLPRCCSRHAYSYLSFPPSPVAVGTYRFDSTRFSGFKVSFEGKSSLARPCNDDSRRNELKVISRRIGRRLAFSRYFAALYFRSWKYASTPFSTTVYPYSSVHEVGGDANTRQRYNLARTPFLYTHLNGIECRKRPAMKKQFAPVGSCPCTPRYVSPLPSIVG